MTSHQQNCTVLLSYDSAFIKESDYQAGLESKDDAVKIDALKSLTAAIANGEQYPKLLMSVIKYCLHSDNHQVKKLLLMYWEVVEKKDKNGVLLSEMILVCNAIKNNICHPNEFIRGATLRFLCKIKEAEILESLIPSIIDNLQHRHSYVRKNVVLTIHSVYAAHPELIPDAPELIETFLYAETNPCAKRNALMMLFLCNQEKAITYLESVLSTLGSSGEAFQLLSLEVMRKACHSNATLKSLYLKAVHALVQSNAHAVSYEAANTLVTLSRAPVAVRAAVNAYCQLLATESENNIKLVILQQLHIIKQRNEKIVSDMLMDILGTLSSPNMEIRRQTMKLALDLLTPRNVEDVVQLLKKELSKCDMPDYAQSSSRGEGYRKLLVDCLHTCAVRYTHVVATVVHILLAHVGDDQPYAALDVVYFVREIVEEYPALRDEVLLKLCASFDDIKHTDAYRVCMWIIGEFATDSVVLSTALESLKNAIGPMPLLSTVTPSASQESKQKEEEDVKTRHHLDRDQAKKPVVLSDGTYASQSSIQTAPIVVPTNTNHSTLRTLLLNGDFFLASTAAATLTKLVLRYVSMVGLNSDEANKEIAHALLVCASLQRNGVAGPTSRTIDPDSEQRIQICFRSLLDPEVGISLFNDAARSAFTAMLADHRAKSAPTDAAKPQIAAQVDDLITIRQLAGPGGEDNVMLSDEQDVSRAVGAINSVAGDLTTSLHRVYQLTGFSDPVYAEAHLSVQSYDIVLELFVVNTTANILQNVTVELHTSGDLKLVERPTVHTLAPHANVKLQAVIKLTSTESGIIFGNVVYDNSAGTSKTIIVLNNIHLDIEDYIAPAYVSDMSFRAMWAEFEWENKVAVSTEIAGLNEYLNHIVRITNMKCLTPQSTLQGEANFLAANLYAKSMFGEDALLNVSIEKQKNGKIVGYLRIRSKTQGIALSLGDKITAKQKHNKV